ncbi:hypothetical protein D9Q98_007672 [Chlorella vulgaris]|uniref:Ubiquitin-like domain-containing protein n=1 Tax=Chlorella vulgaris TaxID=3077 RepID=A0A9D4THF5_CHLVU|nr:hypothetical protein D9Q98_007672 [Chlorella vulgaris]
MGDADSAMATAAQEMDPPKPAASQQPEGQQAEQQEADMIMFKVVVSKEVVTVSRPASSTVADLKADISAQTGIPPENQKLLCKLQLKDEQTLQARVHAWPHDDPSTEMHSRCAAAAGLKNGSKVIVVGSRPEAIKGIKGATRVQAARWTRLPVGSTPGAGGGAGDGGKAGEEGDWDDGKAPAEPWCEQEQHKKVLAQGRPEDGWPGIKDKQVPLRDDQLYIPGLLNGQGTKVRLTFKPELQQLWVGSAASTQKVPCNSIAKMESQVIKGQEEYSILRIQLGAASTSNLFLYFVPSQAVSGIKLRVLGVQALI